MAYVMQHDDTKFVKVSIDNEVRMALAPAVTSDLTDLRRGLIEIIEKQEKEIARINRVLQKRNLIKRDRTHIYRHGWGD